jgi:hypothetical protein
METRGFCLGICRLKFRVLHLFFYVFVLFRWLEFFLIGIFPSDIVYENPILYMCWVDIYIYIYAIWIALFAFVIFRHPIDNCHNTTFFLELTGSNLSWWCYFWIYLCLNLFRNMSSSGSQQSDRQMNPLKNILLLK